jgi:haloalkane dehalogenase
VIPFTLGRRAPRRPSWLHTYAASLDTRLRRRACWTLARSLHRERMWLRALWTHCTRLRECPTLLCWGMDDPAFGTTGTLRRWTSLFSNATVHRRSGVGHYVPEEMGTELVSLVTPFLHSTPP